ncbi:hypothetical protein CPB85DRAFT_1199847, partial [Mucidula mucida]
MSLAAKATFVGACAVSAFTIWAVHHQQTQERENMYQGVIKDDARRREKMQQRQQAFDESQRKRELYESVQKVE